MKIDKLNPVHQSFAITLLLDLCDENHKSPLYQKEILDFDFVVKDNSLDVKIENIPLKWTVNCLQLVANKVNRQDKTVVLTFID